MNLVKGVQSQIELVEGYGVFISKRQLDDAEDLSRNNPTRLIRNLCGIFYTKETLTESSAFGGRRNKVLDRDILSTVRVIHTHIQFYFSYI